jgi:MFS family permease
LGGTKDWAWDSPQILGLLTAAAVGTVAFVFAERRAQDPLLPLRFFRNSIFNVISILFLLFGMAFFGAIIYIPTFAQQVLGFSATNSGVLLLPMILGLTVASIVSGQLVSRTGKYKVFIIIGLALASLGVFTLTGLTIHSGYVDLAWRMSLTGLGLGMAMPIFNLAVQNALPQQDLGVASSSVQLFRSIGGTVGLAITGGILNNLLTSKLTNINDEPFVKTAVASGHGEQFSNITVNSIQGILSPQAQTAVNNQLSHLPEQAKQTAMDNFHHLVTTLQGALASSITHIFLISACVMAVAFIISFGVKEIPLRHHGEVPPSE